MDTSPGLMPRWQLTGGRQFESAPFLVAGIVNITPDSFSDGGQFLTPDSAAERIRQVIAEGADMVDLGAESTRPGAVAIGHEEEWRRLFPALQCCLDLRQSINASGAHSRETLPFAISIDTFRAKTAVAALEAATNDPVDIINDISGASFDPGMAEVLASFRPGYVLGHSPAMPEVMQKFARYATVADELLAWFSSRMNALVRAGLPEERICLDPCIGFGKKLEHTKDIIRAIPRFAALGRPLYFGISRKSFLGEITGLPVGERDWATQVATALLAQAGVAVHRVHQVAETIATLTLVRAMI